jgi:hypothetical protein
MFFYIENAESSQKYFAKLSTEEELNELLNDESKNIIGFQADDSFLRYVYFNTNMDYDRKIINKYYKFQNKEHNELHRENIDKYFIFLPALKNDLTANLEYITCIPNTNEDVFKILNTLNDENPKATLKFKRKVSLVDRETFINNILKSVNLNCNSFIYEFTDYFANDDIFSLSKSKIDQKFDNTNDVNSFLDKLSTEFIDSQYEKVFHIANFSEALLTKHFSNSNGSYNLVYFKTTKDNVYKFHFLFDLLNFFN